MLASVETILPALTAAEARARITRIKGHMAALWFELTDFHNRKGWIPLGYTSFKACVEQELGLSESRAYRLLHAADIRMELATCDVASIDRMTVDHAAELKPLPPEQRLEIAREVDFGQTTVRELREIVQQKQNGMAVHFSSDSDEWYTPPEIIERTITAMGAIDLDPCSNGGANPSVPARWHYTRQDDGLAQTWTGRVYMNPPYGRAIADWVAKLCEEYAAGNVAEAVALVPARTDTDWFRQLRDCAICFIDGRLKFSGMQNSAPFPSAVIYFGQDIARFSRCFADMGDVWVRWSIDTGAGSGRI